MQKALYFIGLCSCLVLLSFSTFTIQNAFSADESEPGTIILNYLENEYTGVEFDHSIHTMIAEECGKMCHHHAGQDEYLACLDCHSIEPSQFQQSTNVQFIPCRDCHDKQNPNNPAMPSMMVAYHQQCFNCHKGVDGVSEGPAGCVELCHEKK